MRLCSYGTASGYRDVQKLLLVFVLSPVLLDFVGVGPHGGARRKVPWPFGEGVGGGNRKAKGDREKRRGWRRFETKEALDGAAKGA